MEGIYEISGNALTSFSEQQLVDCVKLCFGCNGGNYTTVYGQYAKNNYMYTEAGWPYTATGGTCAPPAGASPTGMKTTGYTAVETENEVALKTALAQQPVSVAIQANQFSFQAYKDGVFDSSKCGTQLDHAVLLVGYGVDAESGQPFYLMKNSWGSSWGDKGYMKMAIVGNGPGICGVQMQPAYPLM